MQYSSTFGSYFSLFFAPRRTQRCWVRFFHASTSSCSSLRMTSLSSAAALSVPFRSTVVLSRAVTETKQKMAERTMKEGAPPPPFCRMSTSSLTDPSDGVEISPPTSTFSLKGEDPVGGGTVHRPIPVRGSRLPSPDGGPSSPVFPSPLVSEGSLSASTSTTTTPSATPLHRSHRGVSPGQTSGPRPPPRRKWHPRRARGGRKEGPPADVLALTAMLDRVFTTEFPHVCSSPSSCLLWVASSHGKRIVAWVHDKMASLAPAARAVDGLLLSPRLPHTTPYASPPREGVLASSSGVWRETSAKTAGRVEGRPWEVGGASPASASPPPSPSSSCSSAPSFGMAARGDLRMALEKVAQKRSRAPRVGRTGGGYEVCWIVPPTCEDVDPAVALPPMEEGGGGGGTPPKEEKEEAVYDAHQADRPDAPHPPSTHRLQHSIPGHAPPPPPPPPAGGRVFCLPGSLAAFAAQLRHLSLSKRSPDAASFFFSPSFSASSPCAVASHATTAAAFLPTGGGGEEEGEPSVSMTISSSSALQQWGSVSDRRRAARAVAREKRREEWWRVLGVESPQSVQVLILEVVGEESEEAEKPHRHGVGRQRGGFSSIPETSGQEEEEVPTHSVRSAERWLPTCREGLRIASHMVGSGADDPSGQATGALLFQFHPSGGAWREREKGWPLHSAEVLEAMKAQYGIVRPGHSRCGRMHYLFLSGSATSTAARVSSSSSLWWPSFLASPPRPVSSLVSSPPSTLTHRSRPGRTDGVERGKKKMPRHQMNSCSAEKHRKDEEGSAGGGARRTRRSERQWKHDNGGRGLDTRGTRRPPPEEVPSPTTSGKKKGVSFEKERWPARSAEKPWKELFQRRAAFHRRQQGRFGFPKHFRPMTKTGSGGPSFSPSSASAASGFGGMASTISSSSSSAFASSMLFVPRLVPHFMTARYLPEKEREPSQRHSSWKEGQPNASDEDAIQEEGKHTEERADVIACPSSSTPSASSSFSSTRLTHTAAEKYRQGVAAAAARREAKWEEDEAAFLGVSIDMVTNQSYSRKRDD